MIRLRLSIKVLALMALTVPMALSACDEPPLAPDVGDIEERLGDSIAATRDASANKIRSTRAANLDAKKRLAPDAGGDAGDAGPN